MTETKQDQPPLLTKLALNQLYTKLRDLLSDEQARFIMRKLTGSSSGFMAPEVAQELQDDLIQAILKIVIPIAWWDWEDKQETESGNRTEQQWCVWYGGPDPDNAAGVEMQDDEADAREALQWFRSDLGSGVAVRDLTIGPWRSVDSGEVSR